MKLSGLPVSKGLAWGRVLRYIPGEPEIQSAGIRPQEAAPLLDRWRQILEGEKAHLRALHDALQQEGQAEKADIMAAHWEILDDEEIAAEIEACITVQGMHPMQAVSEVFSGYIQTLEKAGDALIRERATDLKDVRLRLLRAWHGIKETRLSSLDEPVVLVTRDLFPSDTAQMEKDKVLAIVTEVGGETSHSAIMARSLRIPALAGVAGATECLADGVSVVVDALEGEVVRDPGEAQLALYREKQAKFLALRKIEDGYLHREACTLDGVRVEVELNIGSADEAALAAGAFTDGVGLFRSEFLFMEGNTLPDEEKQYQAYRRVLEAFQQRPVVLRTLDVGGDKQLPALPLPHEMNPFLGNRALRLCLSRPALFSTQLRAALRAAAHGNLWLMFPMVSRMEDIQAAKAALEREKEALRHAGIPFGEEMKVGVMVEIPSIALLADQVAGEVDFASIGTNDLCQYSLAVDRMAPEVSGYYQSYHPALFKLIHMVVQAFGKAGKPVGVCGELGGDALAVPALLGLGLRRFSMGEASVAAVKKAVCTTDTPKAEELARQVLQSVSAGQVETLLRRFSTNDF